ncbi:non-specific lipid transfer protein GPI-anchored 5-like [Triticum urartu]|uniref:non-specific lipid transfer protein GPI-anchored 5-like n=1 Tax=Triticum urartu TaxID=4572 RepID=UPI002044680E|nr:non-specific lipid transfer protein GPI-anchored 5-like [Triticum urartu]
MARRRSSGGISSALSLGLAVMAVTWATSTAQQQQQQQPPAVPSVSVPSCPPVQASLSPCVSYFIGNSSSPSDACCSQMQAMFQSQAPCLCAAVSAVPAQLGSVVGGLLPTACNLPPNACSAVTGTSSSAPAGGAAAPSSSGTPTDAAAAAPVTGPADANPAGTPSGGGVKSVPGTVDSAAVECKGTSAAVVVLAMAASFLAVSVF